MTLEFAIQEARRRTDVLKKDHFVYQSLVGDDVFVEDVYIVISRVLSNGFQPVYSAFVDGSELES